MAVFSNSSNQKHSILAGYQRRANQLKARSTSRYNVGTNLGNVANRINDEYNQNSPLLTMIQKSYKIK